MTFLDGSDWKIDTKEKSPYKNFCFVAYFWFFMKSFHDGDDQ